MTWFNKNNIISWSLALVAIWFGAHEILQPTQWTVFVPAFVNHYIKADLAVMIHGAILIICSIGLVIDRNRRIASGILTILFLEIVFNLVTTSGFSDIAVRDIGLLGMALANTLSY